jgi:predicted DNA-binding protein YlxM (UPF0122 family)
MPQDPLSLETIVELYQKQGVTIPEIAKRFGVTKQAVYERLRKAGIRLDSRKRSHYRALDKKKLKELYEQSIPVEEIARHFRAIPNIIRRELKYHRIPQRKEIRGRPNKCPAVKDLKVGESIVVQVPKGRTPHFGYLYKPAKKAGMRITIRRLNATTYKLTRLA